MSAELARAHAGLRLPGYEAPYFIAYTLKEYENLEISAKLGAIFTDDRARDRQLHVEVRVGGYDLDNTVPESEAAMMGVAEGYEPDADAPLDDDPASLRAALWLITDYRYKRALKQLHAKRADGVTRVAPEPLPSFSHEASSRHADPPRPIDIKGAAARLGPQARRLSALVAARPHVLDSRVRMGVRRTVRFYVNSEGSAIVTDRPLWQVTVDVVGRADDGMLLEHGFTVYAPSADELPSEDVLAAKVERVVAELDALRRAPALDPYTGPAILMPQAAGVFFHETVGHRLEGERQNDEHEGRTWSGQVGHPVLPSFLGVEDDPTLERADGVPLNGRYVYDDEGVRARRVPLIDGGRLAGYLLSRTPVRGFIGSNGHGRAEGDGDPMARMGNLIVTSTRTVPLAKLRAMLLDEVRRRGKPFGLILDDVQGGNTNTATYGYQAFKGVPRIVRRIDASSGAETLVRGVELVGTPLSAVGKIIATSDTPGVFNGFCGAESGYVPVSTVAPAILLGEIELQRQELPRERPPILPPP
ncbi:MAG: metallopeptidase TldD-related protein [Myxococcota bacterium]